MADTDQVAADLAEVRKRADDEIRSVAYIPGDVRWSCNDVPRLLAAVEAALAAHPRRVDPNLGSGYSVRDAPCRSHGWQHITAMRMGKQEPCLDCLADVCGGCGKNWPCPEYLDLSRALLGEGGQ